MKHKLLRRVLASVMALLLVIGLLPTTFAGGGIKVSADDGNYTTVEYVFEAKDLTEFAQGSKADGDTEKAGTDNYFELIYSAKSKVDGSKKSFDDGYSSEQRVNFGGKCATDKNSIKITTSNPATVKVWWAEGGEDNRQITVLNAAGEEAAKTSDTVAKNAACISTLELSDAGTYYIGSTPNNNYIFKVVVTEKVPVEEPKTYSFETKDLTAFAAEAKADGDTEKAGTDSYFELIYSKKSKVDSSSKTFEDGYTSGQRVNFGGKCATDKNAVKFTTSNAATVKVWWVEGGEDNRQMAVLKSDGTVAAQTKETLSKNAACISTLELSDAGTYYLGGLENNNYIFKVEVTETPGGAVRPSRADWSTVEAPVITGVALDESDKNTVKVTVNANVSYDGADKVVVSMNDEAGNEAGSRTSSAEKAVHELAFTPDASGSYTFTASLVRDGEENKTSNSETFEFVLPLTAPVISYGVSLGGGKVELKWSEVKEAESYTITVDGTDKTYTTSDLSYVVDGLAADTTYTFKIVANRGADVSSASSIDVKVTAEEQRVWAFSRYGSSVDTKNNGVTGSFDDGQFTVFSEGGKGKIVPGSTDGLTFYYTIIDPETENFTLTAKVHVDKWTLSNGQEGFGMMVADTVGKDGDGTAFWNNSYMLGATKMEYYYDGESVTTDTTAAKISMKIGLGGIVRLGVTADDVAAIKKGEITMPANFSTESTTLETSCATQGSGTYNIVGNFSGVEPTGTVAEPVTDFVLQLQRNNTGYVLRYLDNDGNVIAEKLYYDLERNSLTQIDKDNIYLGFYASRNARITVSDVKLEPINPADDAPAQDREYELVYPNYVVESATVANSKDYTLTYYGNADGTLTVTAPNGEKIADNVKVEANKKYNFTSEIAVGDNTFTVSMTPDADFVPGEYKKLTTYETSTFTHTVNYKHIGGEKYIYVAPNGNAGAAGGKTSPVDIYTAVKYAAPGQVIVLAGGTYNLTKTVKVERGINGTADNMIYMVADPDASERPVFDFGRNCAGMILAGDYWYFEGFDVTGSADATKGLQLSGSNNTLDSINAYKNGNTGIQVSRYLTSDQFDQWPANNLILNCTSYLNADKGYEDADGFAAKLTVGEGNVFDGCIAAYNADDGWDLFAKVQTGSIGAVTIQNCVTFRNGYVLRNEAGELDINGTVLVDAGNGNGFKMGGDSMSGKHVLKNSIAFENKAKGFDSNSCPDIRVYSSTTYNNESYNVAFYTNTAVNTDFVADGVLSIKTNNNVKETFKLLGTQDNTKVYGESNYYFDGNESVNSVNAKADVSWFTNVDTTNAISLLFNRNTDGTIDMKGLFDLADAVPANVGARMTGKASVNTSDLVADNEEPTEPEEPSETPSEEPSETPSEEPTEAPSVEPTTQAPASSAPSGTSVGDSVVSGTDSTVTETVGRDGYVSDNVFASLIKDNKTLVVNVTDDNGEVIATFTIDGSTFNSVPDSLFRLNVKLNDYTPASEKTRELLQVEDKDMLVCTFDSVGYLNGKVSVTVKADGFAAGTQLKLYYYNEELNTVMDKNQIVTVGEDGKVTFTVDHFSTYVLVDAGKALVTAPSTGVKTSASGLMGIILLAGGVAGACFFRKRR